MKPGSENRGPEQSMLLPYLASGTGRRGWTMPGSFPLPANRPCRPGKPPPLLSSPPHAGGGRWLGLVPPPLLPNHPAARVESGLWVKGTDQCSNRWPNSSLEQEHLLPATMGKATLCSEEPLKDLFPLPPLCNAAPVHFSQEVLLQHMVPIRTWLPGHCLLLEEG